MKRRLGVGGGGKERGKGRNWGGGRKRGGKRGGDELVYGTGMEVGLQGCLLARFCWVGWRLCMDSILFNVCAKVVSLAFCE